MEKNRIRDLKLTKEDKLLLLCAQTPINNEMKDKIKSLIHKELDWNHLLKSAMLNKLTPLLYWNLNNICPRSIPPEIIEQLKTYFHHNTRKNLLYMGELLKILELLDSQGILAIPYKGPVMAADLYGNLALREFVDLDIFIEKQNILKAKEILISHGFMPVFQFNKSQEKIYLNYHRHYNLTKEANNISIELHWKFPSASFSSLNDFEKTIQLKNLKTIRINNFLTSELPIDILILILCMHNASHNWSSLNWICDLSQLINSKDNINWSQLIRKADQFDIKRILFINIYLIINLFNLDVPNEVKYELKSDEIVEIISIQIMKRLFSEKTSITFIEKAFLRLKIRENKINKIKDILRPVLIPTPIEIEKVTLNMPFFPYIILRTMRLISVGVLQN